MLDSYHSIILPVIVFASYLATYFCYASGKIKLITHRKIWNTVLLISFLASGFAGLILAILMDQKINYYWYREFLWFHVELGIVMAVVSLFHAFWHWNYFKTVWKLNK